MLPRFHVPDGLAPGATVELPTEAAHHAMRVLRLDEGDPVTLFDGRGGEWFARLVRSGPSVRAVLESFAPADHAPPLAITLVQALPAADKMDWILQKATELGVAAIQPVAAKRSVVRLSGERMERRGRHWQQITVAACEQCGMNRVPAVAPLLDLPQYLAMTASHDDIRLFLAPGAERSLRNMQKPERAAATLLIGPEGGFEEGEARAIGAAGFLPVSLGPRVLRTETAGIAAISAMLALWGDF